MTNMRILLLCLSLTICFAANEPPRYRIVNLVNKNTLTDDENKRITQYAREWAEALDTTGTTELFSARQRLISPLEPDVDMSPYVRSIYCNSVIDGIGPLLHPNNKNEMGLVNALQVLSVIGNEQTSRLLLNSADSEDEKRDSARLWASIGLGKSFTVGVLPLRRIKSDAKRLANYIVSEPKWFVIAEQFSSLAALQRTPNLDSRQREELGAMSLDLQTDAIGSLINAMGKTGSDDERIFALSIVLPSLRIQLIDPDLDANARTKSQKELVQYLCKLVSVSVEHAETTRDNELLFNAHGQAMNVAGLIVDRELNLNADGRVSLWELWNDGNTLAITDRVAQWQSSSKY